MIENAHSFMKRVTDTSANLLKPPAKPLQTSAWGRKKKITFAKSLLLLRHLHTIRTKDRLGDAWAETGVTVTASQFALLDDARAMR